MEKKTTVGVSGNQGSFSEQAGRYYCEKNKMTDFDLRYLVSVEKVLSALEKDDIETGIFPIENSNGGIVLEAVYAMSRHNFQIENIFEIDVRHQLLVLPGKRKADIKKITSHPQALKQCRMHLKRKWKDAELEEYNDTAGAAKDLSEGKLPSTVAVIASEICASLYNLEIMESDIQDLKFNFTSFIVAKKAVK